MELASNLNHETFSTNPNPVAEVPIVPENVPVKLVTTPDAGVPSATPSAIVTVPPDSVIVVTSFNFSVAIVYPFGYLVFTASTASAWVVVPFFMSLYIISS